MFYVKD